MSGRTVLADYLADHLPAWLIVATARQLDGIPKPGACVLWTSKRERLALNGIDMVKDTVELWVLTATDKPELIEDDLDQLLETVLAVLEPHAESAWTSADRGVLADKYQGWRIELTTLARIDNTEPETEGA